MKTRRHTVLARISHRVLNIAKLMSSKEAPMRAREAKPRPSRERHARDTVSAHKRTVPQERILFFPRLGAVLPQPGFLCHLPGGEKPGLGLQFPRGLGSADSGLTRVGGAKH